MGYHKTQTPLTVCEVLACGGGHKQIKTYAKLRAHRIGKKRINWMNLYF